MDKSEVREGVRSGVRHLSLLALAAVSIVLSGTAFGMDMKYVHTDAQGNVIVLTDQNGNIVEEYVYEPYGLPVASVPDGPGYTGHIHDGDTGLIYMQQRYYDPQVGRFLSVDPVLPFTTDGSNFNRYWYANNNPYTYVDPDGEFGQLAVGFALGGLVGGGVETYKQLKAGGDLGDLDFGKIGGAALEGGVVGLAASTGAGIAANLGVGLAGKAALATSTGTTAALTNNLIEAEMSGEFPTTEEYLTDSFAEGAGGGAGAVTQGVVRSAAASAATEVLIKEGAASDGTAATPSENGSSKKAPDVDEL